MGHEERLSRRISELRQEAALGKVRTPKKCALAGAKSILSQRSKQRTGGRCRLSIPRTNLDRRKLLKTVAGAGGLLIGFYWSAPTEILAAPPAGRSPAL